MDIERRTKIMEMIMKVAISLEVKKEQLPSLKHEVEDLKDIHEEIQES